MSVFLTSLDTLLAYVEHAASEDEYKLKKGTPKGRSTAAMLVQNISISTCSNYQCYRTPSQKGKSRKQDSPGFGGDDAAITGYVYPFHIFYCNTSVASRNVVKSTGKQNRPGTPTDWEDSSDGGKLPLARSMYMPTPDR